MSMQLMHPRDQLVAIMNRIYHGGMTTLSGGNLSIRDQDDDVWDDRPMSERDCLCEHVHTA